MRKLILLIAIVPILMFLFLPTLAAAAVFDGGFTATSDTGEFGYEVVCTGCSTWADWGPVDISFGPSAVEADDMSDSWEGTIGYDSNLEAFTVFVQHLVIPQSEGGRRSTD